MISTGQNRPTADSFKAKVLDVWDRFRCQEKYRAAAFFFWIGKAACAYELNLKSYRNQISEGQGTKKIMPALESNYTLDLRGLLDELNWTAPFCMCSNLAVN
jgi:hypothetical protein